MKNVLKRFHKLVLPVIFSILLMVSHLSCAPGQIDKEKTTPKFSGRKILVLPVKDMSRIYGQNKSIISPFGGKYFFTGMVMDGADMVLTDYLVDYIKKRPDYICFPPSRAEGPFAEMLADMEGGTWNTQYLSKVGRKCRTDAVFTGCVYRFQQRVGNPHSVDAPASVEFEIHLIDSANGSIIWSGFYNETQQALSENLLNIKKFMKRKGRWISAEEMAISGLLDILRTFPDYANNTGD